MTEETTAQDGQTAESVDTEQQQQGTEQPAPAEIQAELERIRKALKDANKEAETRRKKLEAFEAAEKQRQEAELSELQKLQKRLEEETAAKAELETKLRTNTIRAAAIAKANELNFTNPADALALIDLAGAEIDDTGKVTGFEKALDDLAKSGRLPMKNQQGAGIGNQTRTKAASNNNEQKQQPALNRRIRL